VRLKSVTLSRKTYRPAALNVALVESDVGLVKLTVPGPLTFDHA
jgi:hypothetical protein